MTTRKDFISDVVGISMTAAFSGCRNMLAADDDRCLQAVKDAVDPERDFAGVVLGNQLAGKPATMGPRMHILDMMCDDGCRR